MFDRPVTYGQQLGYKGHLLVLIHPLSDHGEVHRGVPLEVEEIGEDVVVGISKDFHHVDIYLTMVLSQSPVFWDDRQQSRWKDDWGDGNSNDEVFAEESVPNRSHFEGPCS